MNEETAADDASEEQPAAPSGPNMQKIEVLLAECVEFGHKKSAGRGRCRDLDAEKTKAKWARTAAYCARSLLALQKRRKLQEFDRRLSAIEASGEPASGEQSKSERADALLDELEGLV